MQIFHLLVKVVISTFLVVLQSLSRVWLSLTSWTAAHQTSLSSSVSWSLLKFMLIELVILSNHLILITTFSFCPQSFPSPGSFPVNGLFASRGQSIGASASASVLPMKIQSWFSLGLTGLISLLSTLRVYYLPYSYISQFYMSPALLITFFRFLVVPQSCCFSIYILRIWEFLTVFPYYVSVDFTFFPLYFPLYFY